MTLNNFISIFGWALIHSLWQAAIIYVALYLSLRIFRHAPAHIKYWLAYLALAGIFLCFLVTFYSLLNNQQNMREVALSAVAGSLSIETIKNFAAAPKTSEFNLWEPAMWINYFVLLYGAGLLFFMGKIIRDFLVMRHIRFTRIKPFDTAWEHYLDKLRIAWKIPQKVKLFLSEYLDVPVVIGYLKPVIYLPLTAATNLSPEQIEAILLHELAHIRRYDFVANIFQTFIETIFFFNPFIWLISKIIRRERENSCDDLVLSAAQPALYAETLLALAENQLYKGNFVLAASGKKQQLFHRIKRIMEMKTKKLNIMQKLLVLFILAVGVISVSWLIPEKKSDQQSKNSGYAFLKKARSSSVQHPVDTSALPLPPAPPLTLSVPPAAPSSVAFPPAPPTHIPTPPIPVIAPVDTFPSHFPDDSAIDNMQHQMKQYFNSDAWQKYQQDLQSYQQHIQKYFQSKEWKKHQEEMQKLSMQMSKMARSFDTSTSWRVYKNSLRAEAEKMNELFNNREWKLNMDSLKQQLGRDRINMDSLMVKDRIKFSFDRVKMDSLMTEARKKWALVRMHQPNMFFFSNEKAVNPNEIVHMMENDG
ncbi:MAG: M56 family metallopeptidase, partial [Chitinophagaceae bacterium]